jgi:Pentapeptide repeats (8 copies)
MGPTKWLRWTGFVGYDKISTTTETGTTSPLEKHTTTVTHQPGKTLWDGLNLLAILAIPLILGIATLLFGMQQAHLADLQHQSDQKIALDQQEATTLQIYIDNIQDLLLNHNLLKSKPGTDVATLAQARTLSTLEALDRKRKGTLLKFLYEAHLININYGGAIIILNRADLSDADLSDADLNRADLSWANLQRANIDGTDLFGTNLSNANLKGANLRNANLTEVIWGNTICPDDTNSDADGGSCMGHIKS